MNDKQILNVLKDFVKTKYQMVVATNGEHPWIAPVYYSVDDELNFYFLSDPETIHCKQIAKNPKVAVSIADAPQNPSAKKKGIQLYGIAEEIAGKQRIIHALTLWRKTLGVTDNAYTYQGMMEKLISGRMYKVIPKKIKFFNQELWEEGKEPLIEL